MNATPATVPSATVAAPQAEVFRRRNERRVAHRVPCRVRTTSGSHGMGISALGQTVNLSANGLAVQLGQPIAHGVAVEILLPHLDGEPTRLVGTVAHSRRVLSGTFEIGIWIDPE